MADYHATLLKFPSLPSKLIRNVRTMFEAALEQASSSQPTPSATRILHYAQTFAKYVASLFNGNPASMLYGYLTPHANEIFATVYNRVSSLCPKPTPTRQFYRLHITARGHPSKGRVSASDGTGGRYRCTIGSYNSQHLETITWQFCFWRAISIVSHRSSVASTLLASLPAGSARQRCGGCLLYTHCSRNC